MTDRIWNNIFDRLNDPATFHGVYAERFRSGSAINGAADISEIRLTGHNGFPISSKSDRKLDLKFMTRPNLNPKPMHYQPSVEAAERSRRYLESRLKKLWGIINDVPLPEEVKPLVPYTITDGVVTLDGLSAEENTVLALVFQYFVRFGKSALSHENKDLMDSFSFNKFVTSCEIPIDHTEVDLLFIRVKGKDLRRRRIDYAEFLDCLVSFSRTLFPTNEDISGEGDNGGNSEGDYELSNFLTFVREFVIQSYVGYGIMESLENGTVAPEPPVLWRDMVNGHSKQIKSPSISRTYSISESGSSPSSTLVPSRNSQSFYNSNVSSSLQRVGSSLSRAGSTRIIKQSSYYELTSPQRPIEVVEGGSKGDSRDDLSITHTVDTEADVHPFTDADASDFSNNNPSKISPTGRRIVPSILVHVVEGTLEVPPSPTFLPKGSSSSFHGSSKNLSFSGESSPSALSGSPKVISIVDESLSPGEGSPRGIMRTSSVRLQLSPSVPASQKTPLLVEKSLSSLSLKGVDRVGSNVIALPPTVVVGSGGFGSSNEQNGIDKEQIALAAAKAALDIVSNSSSGTEVIQTAASTNEIAQNEEEDAFLVAVRGAMDALLKVPASMTDYVKPSSISGQSPVSKSQQIENVDHMQALIQERAASFYQQNAPAVGSLTRNPDSVSSPSSDNAKTTNSASSPHTNPSMEDNRSDLKYNAPPSVPQLMLTKLPLSRPSSSPILSTNHADLQLSRSPAQIRALSPKVAENSTSPTSAISSLPRTSSKLGTKEFKAAVAGEANKPGGVYDRLSSPSSYTGAYRHLWKAGMEKKTRIHERK